MTHQGRLTEWNDERGFGFVTPLDGGSSAFVHISRFTQRLRRPRLNELLAYSIEYDTRGRAQASVISFLIPAPSTLVPSDGWQLTPVLIVSAFLVVLLAAINLGSVPAHFLGLYLPMSALLYAMYAIDKSAAQSGEWRISELKLHLVALLGGWPGGLIARHKLRHKTIKQPFRFIFWCTVVLNCLGLGFASLSFFKGLANQHGDRAGRPGEIPKQANASPHTSRSQGPAAARSLAPFRAPRLL